MARGTDDAGERVDGVVQDQGLVLLAGLQVEAAAVDDLHLLDDGALARVAGAEEQELDLAALPLALRAEVAVDASGAGGAASFSSELWRHPMILVCRGCRRRGNRGVRGRGKG